jgi:FkbM family methyltransferase
MEKWLKPYFLQEIDGRVYFLRTGDNSANILTKEKSYEPHITSIFRALVKPGDHVVDLGANIGFHTIELSKLVGDKGRVVAAEPLKEVYYHLAANLFLNRCFNVDLLNKVCTDVNNSSFVMEEIEWGNSGNCRIKKQHDKLGEEAVQSFTLDDIDCSKVSLIKMDVQGSEENVLKGATKVLRDVRPYFVVEIEEHHLLEFGSSSKNLLNKFIEHDYVLYRIHTPYPCDHVAVPREKVTVDFQKITGYNVSVIDKKVLETTIRWPLYEKAITEN